MNLNTARVFVRDLGAAEPFYSKQLGLPLRAGGPSFGYCVYNAGNTQLIVESVPPEAPRDEQVLIGRFTGLSFAVADVGAKHKELLAVGVHFTGAPERQAWAGFLPRSGTQRATKCKLLRQGMPSNNPLRGSH